MRIAVLGPLEVLANDAAPVAVPGAEERLLLAVLAAGVPEPVSADRLIEALWNGDPPDAALESLRAHLRRLRAALEPGLPERSSGQYVLRRGSGYVLAVGHGDVDARRFTDLAARGRADVLAGRPADAVRSLATALGLWRGTPYADWADAAFAVAERERLTAIRDAAAEQLLAAQALAPAAVEPEGMRVPAQPWLPQRPRWPEVPLPDVAFPDDVLPDPVPVPADARPPDGPPPRADAPVVPPPDGSGRAEPSGRRTLPNTHPTMVRAAALVALLAAVLVAALWSGRSSENAEETATVADANRLAALSVTEDSVGLSLLMAAEAYRLADTPQTRGGLTHAVDGHERVERAASFPGVPQDPVLSSGRTLTFGVGNSVVGWSIGPMTVPRVIMPIPGQWGAWLVAAPSPVEDVVMGAGVAQGGPWLRRVSALDGTSRLLLQGDQVGGRPVDGVVTADGRRLLLLVAAEDDAAPGDAARWQLLDLDAADGSGRPTGIGGVVAGPIEGVRAHFADDAGSVVVWDDSGTPAATLVQLPEGRQVPIAAPPRPAATTGFRALGTGVAQLWDDGVVTLVDRAGATVQELNVHRETVQDVAVSADGRWAVTVGDGAQVFRWDVDPATGRWSGPERLAGHVGDVVGVEVDAVGRRMATVSLDGTAISWDMSGDDAGRGADDPGARLDAACAIVGRDFTPAEWRLVLPDRPWQPTCTDVG